MDNQYPNRSARALKSILLSLVVTVVACEPAPQVCLPPEEKKPGAFRVENIVAGPHLGSLRVRGFTDSSPANAKLRIEFEGGEMQGDADEHGRFDVAQQGPWASLPTEVFLSEVGLPGTRQRVRVRDFSRAAECAQAERYTAGTIPNDIAFSLCGDETTLLSVSSGEASVVTTPVSPQGLPTTTFFPMDAQGVGANPWHVALHPSRPLAAATLWGQHQVALVNPCTGEVLDVAAANVWQGEPRKINVSPPVRVTFPIDADGDGAEESEISAMLPSHPQALAFVGDRLLVSYANLLEFGAFPQAGPGLIIAFDVVDTQLIPAEHAVLPYQNPQSIIVDGGAVWVSNSSLLAAGPEGFAATGEGGLLQLQPTPLTVSASISFGDFAPGTPAFSDQRIVVGSLIHPQIAILSKQATTLTDMQVHPLPDAMRTESIFEVLPWRGGLFLATEYGTDRLIVVDVDQEELHPWPFSNGIPIVSPGDAPRGLLAIASNPHFRYGTGDPDYAVLLTQSGEKVPLTLWQWMGP